MSELKYWLWLSAADASANSKGALIARYGDAEAAFLAPAGEFASVPGVSRRDAEILESRDMSSSEYITEQCGIHHIDIISYQDAAYPGRLRNIYAPPAVLYVRGRLPRLDDSAAIAVVGTRRASRYGIKMARSLSREIVDCGGIILSGLTDGVDGAAAAAALAAGGICVGVLGTSHEEDRNALSRDVAARGAVISEYPPGRKSQRGFFRERNRITAGLSVGVVAVEAPKKSGTALFVNEAAEQGKEIFAVPGNADSENSVGTIEFLKDGAKLVTCGWDVMSEFEWLYPDKIHRVKTEPRFAAQREETDSPLPKVPKKVIDKGNDRGYIDLKEQLKDLSEDQLKIITAIDNDATHIDDIIEATGLSTATVLAQLTFLEIKGYVRREAGRRISLNTAKK
ncbi:MAG: DNA-processing protein DprA [Candidatus Limivicinus sp.]|jgi:DNA processing protein